jgi:GrpB-like predicted nucleotidyltransferase (UPF0157 family)
MYGMDKKKLQLMPYDVSWKDDFLSESERIKSAAHDSSIQIEHVGSTSIPNIYAKPILDMAILCGEKGLEVVANALENLGYDYRGQFDEKQGHFYAVLDKGSIRFVQAHIYTEETEDWHSKLMFRDVLRENAELVKEYNDYKIKDKINSKGEKISIVSGSEPR